MNFGLIPPHLQRRTKNFSFYPPLTLWPWIEMSFFFPFILLHLFIYLFIVILQKMTYISLWFSLLYRVCSILIQYNKSLFIQRVIRYLQTYQKVSWKVVYSKLIWSTVSWSISPQQCEVTDAYWQTALNWLSLYLSKMYYYKDVGSKYPPIFEPYLPYDKNICSKYNSKHGSILQSLQKKGQLFLNKPLTHMGLKSPSENSIVH